MASKLVTRINLIWKILFLVIIIFLFIFIVSTYSFRIYTRNIIAESKNAELALHLLAYDYYGKDQHIYNPLTPDGLAEGVAEEVREMSGAEGTLILGSWDAARQAPRSFTYITGKFVVVYNYDEQEESHWKLCYQFKEAAKPEW